MPNEELLSALKDAAELLQQLVGSAESAIVEALSEQLSEFDKTVSEQ